MDSGFKVDYEKLLSASNAVGNVLDVLQSAIHRADSMIGSIPSDCSYSDIIYAVKEDLISEGFSISDVNEKIVSTLNEINGLDDIFSTEGKDLTSMSDEELKKIQGSEWAVTIDTIDHMNEYESGSGDRERERRIAFLGGFKDSDAEQRTLMVDIEVPVWDGEKEITRTLTVNKKLVDNYKGAFREVCDLKFPFNTNPEENAFCAYAWEHYRGENNDIRSDHALGGTFDINTTNNWETGDDSDYSVKNRPDVIQAFEKYGFFWGGYWDNNKDNMHFSFTGY